MRFIGVDLAWTVRGGTGLCLVEDGAVRGSGRVGGDEELLAWLRPLTGADVVVAVDAPLIVRNARGGRPAEQAISRCFGAYHASTHSANLGLPAFGERVRGEWLAEALALDVDPAFASGVPVRRAIEVYPHTAIVALFRLASTLKYKAKPHRTLASRVAGLTELLRHLESLADADPPLDVAAAPRWRDLATTVATARSSADLRGVEDEIDAYICAYIGLYYWTHGTSRCRVVGDLVQGYIVTPVTPELGGCLDRLSAETDHVATTTPPRPLEPQTAQPSGAALLARLETGPAHRFADFATVSSSLPSAGAGIYTIWDEAGALVYVGVAGRNPTGRGLASRLGSHASGRRSGDQFCVYVADHYVLPELTREQIEAIRDARLSMDALVRDKVHAAFSFRFAAATDYRTALRVEAAIKGGRLRAGRPRLNPSK